MELTEVRTGGQDWWTLGFEATGPEDALRSALQATATHVFARAMPGSVEPGPVSISTGPPGPMTRNDAMVCQ